MLDDAQSTSNGPNQRLGRRYPNSVRALAIHLRKRVFILALLQHTRRESSSQNNTRAVVTNVITRGERKLQHTQNTHAHTRRAHRTRTPRTPRGQPYYNILPAAKAPPKTYSTREHRNDICRTILPHPCCGTFISTGKAGAPKRYASNPREGACGNKHASTPWLASFLIKPPQPEEPLFVHAGSSDAPTFTPCIPRKSHTLFTTSVDPLLYAPTILPVFDTPQSRTKTPIRRKGAAAKPRMALTDQKTKSPRS